MSWDGPEIELARPPSRPRRIPLRESLPVVLVLCVFAWIVFILVLFYLWSVIF